MSSAIKRYKLGSAVMIICFMKPDLAERVVAEAEGALKCVCRRADTLCLPVLLCGGWGLTLTSLSARRSMNEEEVAQALRASLFKLYPFFVWQVRSAGVRRRLLLRHVVEPLHRQPRPLCVHVRRFSPSWAAPCAFSRAASSTPLFPVLRTQVIVGRNLGSFVTCLDGFYAHFYIAQTSFVRAPWGWLAGSTATRLATTHAVGPSRGCARGCCLTPTVLGTPRGCAAHALSPPPLLPPSGRLGVVSRAVVNVAPPQPIQSRNVQ